MPNDPTFITRKGYKLLDTTPTEAGGQALNANFTHAGDHDEATDAAIASLNTTVTSMASQTAVDALVSQIGTKADQTALQDATDQLQGQIGELNDAISQKANQNALDAHVDDPQAHASLFDDLRNEVLNDLSSFVTYANLTDALGYEGPWGGTGAKDDRPQVQPDQDRPESLPLDRSRA
ncbi:MAG: hypothetical protein QM754_16205 [Tepidisphaeraceae bacterium]